MEQLETKVYTVEVECLDINTDTIKVDRYVAFAKTISEIEDLAEKKAGDLYRGIRGIQHMADFEPLIP